MDDAGQSEKVEEGSEWFSSRFEAWWKQQRKPNHLGKQLETSKPWKSKQYRSLNRVSVGRVLADMGISPTIMSGLAMMRLN